MRWEWGEKEREKKDGDKRDGARKNENRKERRKERGKSYWDVERLAEESAGSVWKWEISCASPLTLSSLLRPPPTPGFRRPPVLSRPAFQPPLPGLCPQPVNLRRVWVSWFRRDLHCASSSSLVPAGAQARPEGGACGPVLPILKNTCSFVDTVF